MIQTRRQVHCLLDCYAELLRLGGGRDARPLYIGVWNAHFEATAGGLSYYSDSVDELAKWRSRFERLYSCTVRQWHGSAGGEDEAFARLETCMRSEARDNRAILMVDLYDLPYAQQYRERHSPHFVVLVRQYEGDWELRDPYLDWEGKLSRDELRRAFMRDGAVIVVDGSELRGPRVEAIRAVFAEEAAVRENRLLIELSGYVRSAVERGGGRVPKHLLQALQHTAVIAKRMEGYRHALHYFAGAAESAGSLAQVAELIRGIEGLLFVVARSEMTGMPLELKPFEEKVDRLRSLDCAIREELDAAYAAWESETGGMA